MGRERESERLDRGNRLKKTGETVDRRRNNGSVKAVSPRHCPATCALCNCSFNFCAGQSLRQCPLNHCWRTTWTTRSKRRPTCPSSVGHVAQSVSGWGNMALSRALQIAQDWQQAGFSMGGFLHTRLATSVWVFLFLFFNGWVSVPLMQYTRLATSGIFTREAGGISL